MLMMVTVIMMTMRTTATIILLTTTNMMIALKGEILDFLQPVYCALNCSTCTITWQVCATGLNHVQHVAWASWCEGQLSY